MNCLTSRGIRIAVTYQPASRYWPLQWTDTGIYLVLSLALAGYCFQRLSRLSCASTGEAVSVTRL